MSRKKPETVDELLARLNADPQFRARQAEQDAKRRELSEALALAEKPVVDDLQRACIPVRSVGELLNSRLRRDAAVPILLSHLKRPYPLPLLQAMARALAVPQARPVWHTLREMFEENNEETTNGLKWALGCALAGAADDTVLPDIIRIVRDKRHGQNRIALFAALEHSTRPEARGVLLQLRHEPELAVAVRQSLHGDFDG